MFAIVLGFKHGKSKVKRAICNTLNHGPLCTFHKIWMPTFIHMLKLWMLRNSNKKNKFLFYFLIATSIQFSVQFNYFFWGKNSNSKKVKTGSITPTRRSGEGLQIPTNSLSHFFPGKCKPELSSLGLSF